MSEHKGLRTRIIHTIWAERERQIDLEGFDAAHDDAHKDGSLGLAAACYAAPFPIQAQGKDDAWPWAPEWDKRAQHSRKRQLVIAAALIVAELERLELAHE